MLTILRELVKRKSENPPGQCQRVLKYVYSFLKKHTGAQVVFQHVTSDRGNIIAIFGKPKTLINAHLDTVPVSGTWHSDPFALRRTRGKLYGRGTTDVKGAVAAMLAALKEKSPRHALLLFDSDEESGGGDCVQTFLTSRYRQGVVCGVVTEPTDLNIVTMHKGIRIFEITFSGRAAHAALPERGVNAIAMAAHFIVEVDEYARSLSRRSFRNLTKATINVGTIQGGTKFNVVPDSVVLEVDRRILPGRDEHGAEREMKHLLKRFKRHATLRTKYSVPALQSSAKLPVVRILQKAGARTATGVVDFWTEAALFTRAGIPCVVCGPGRIDQAHIADEFIAIKDLQQARDMYVRLFSLL